MINNFDKLKVLKQSHALTLKIYQLTKSFPNEEKFRLSDQLCRSSSSVSANIVEGNCRKTKKEFIQFLHQAKSSLSETQYHLLLAKDLKLIKTDVFNQLINESDEIGKMISGLISYLNK
jgi:four helix bundle protein